MLSAHNAGHVDTWVRCRGHADVEKEAAVAVGVSFCFLGRDGLGLRFFGDVFGGFAFVSGFVVFFFFFCDVFWCYCMFWHC